MATAVYKAPWSLSAPPRVEVVSGLVRQDNFVPSRRFREDGLDDLKLSSGEGARVNTLLGAPAVAKQTRTLNNDYMQVQVKRVVSTPQRKLNDLDFGGHAALFVYEPTFMDRTLLVARVFYLVLVYTDFGSNGSGTTDFGTCPILYTRVYYILHERLKKSST